MVTSDRPANIAVFNEDQTQNSNFSSMKIYWVIKTLGEVNEIIYKSSFDEQEIQGWYITPPDFDPLKNIL